MPANNSPRTAGSLSLLKSSANIFAAKRRIASEINTRIIDSCSAANLIFHQQFNIINIHSICLKAAADWWIRFYRLVKFRKCQFYSGIWHKTNRDNIIRILVYFLTVQVVGLFATIAILDICSRNLEFIDLWFPLEIKVSGPIKGIL